MISPEAAPTAAPALTIPVAALAIEGTAPEAGEEFTLPNVTARIVSIDGNQARIEIVAIDGNPIDAAGAEPDADEDMRQAAMDADSASY